MEKERKDVQGCTFQPTVDRRSAKIIEKKVRESQMGNYAGGGNYSLVASFVEGDISLGQAVNQQSIRGPQALHDLHKTKMQKREQQLKTKLDREVAGLSFKPDLSKNNKGNKTKLQLQDLLFDEKDMASKDISAFRSEVVTEDLRQLQTELSEQPKQRRSKGQRKEKNHFYQTTHMQLNPQTPEKKIPALQKQQREELATLGDLASQIEGVKEMIKDIKARKESTYVSEVNTQRALVAGREDRAVGSGDKSQRQEGASLKAYIAKAAPKKKSWK